MSTKNLNKKVGSLYRMPYIQPKNQLSKKGKYAAYSRKKYYCHEEKENTSNNVISKFGSEKDSAELTNFYENEYQDLMYHQNEGIWDHIIFYIGNGKSEEYNNFRTKFKTELCHNWEMYGSCKYGDTCAFAHGESELQKKALTFNYKTKPCKQFFELGYCSYGSRCQFSHKKADLSGEKKINEDDDKVSYLKIIKEFLSEENTIISHELVKRPRLKTFETITGCSLEESQNSKLQLYDDIISIKSCISKKLNNLKFKISEDSMHTSASSNEKDTD